MGDKKKHLSSQDLTDFSSGFLDFKISKAVSLTAGMEYGMERWNGKWNGTVNVHSYS